MEDLKKLNELDMNSYLPQAVVPEEEKQIDFYHRVDEDLDLDQSESLDRIPLKETSNANVKVDYMAQIKKAREQAVVEFKFAEEEILQKIEEEKKVKIEQQRYTDQKIISSKAPKSNEPQKNLKVKQNTKPSK